jgi:hypothetical protein
LFGQSNVFSAPVLRVAEKVCAGNRSGNDWPQQPFSEMTLKSHLQCWLYALPFRDVVPYVSASEEIPQWNWLPDWHFVSPASSSRRRSAEGNI